MLEAHHVVAEKLSGLAAEAARHAPAQAGPATPGGSARRTEASAGMDEDWISELVELLWPYIKAAVEQMAWEMLPDILEASKPGFISNIVLKKCLLGDTAPDISDIRVWRDENDVMEDCFLEFHFDWRSQQDVELEVQVLPASMDKGWIPNFIEQPLKDLLTFSVGVEEAALRGRMRMTLRPLLRRLPVVGAVQVSFVELPELDFDLTLDDTTNVPMEPALKSWLKQTLLDGVFQSYVVPEHFFLQVDAQAEDIESPVGVLLVEVVEARKVPKMDLLTRSQPFVELFVRASQRRTTTVKGSTRHPRWGESFELPVHAPEHQELKLILYDFDWASATDEIGRCALPLSELQPGQAADLWLDVISESTKEWEEKKAGMRKRDRAKVAAVKPLTKSGGKDCRLHVQATYVAFSDADEELIKQGQRRGMREMLDSRAGLQIDPRLRRLLQSGSLQVKVARVEGLRLSSLFGRASVQGHVRCRFQETELAAVKASRQGTVQFDTPVQLDLGPDATQSASSQVEVELQRGGWFGGGVGRVRVALQDVMRERQVSQSYRLEGESGGALVHLELTWRPYF